MMFWDVDSHRRSKDHMYGTVLVADNSRFDEVPGLEVIAEGESPKVLGSISVGAQGRYLYWGYTHEPREMTEFGQELFVNCLRQLHTNRFRSTIPHLNDPRDTLANYLKLGREIEGYSANALKHFLNSVSELKKIEGTTLENCEIWYKENRDFLYAGENKGPYGQFKVDTEAKTLGTPNNSLKSLKVWTNNASDDTELGALARACLERYVEASLVPADKDWKAWFAAQAGKLCFADGAGFCWRPDPEHMPETGPSAIEIFRDGDDLIVANTSAIDLKLSQLCFDDLCMEYAETIAAGAIFRVPLKGPVTEVHLTFSSPRRGEFSVYRDVPVKIE